MIRWTDDDTDRLVAWWTFGLNVHSIAAELDRSVSAIHHKVQALRATNRLGAPQQAYLPERGYHQVPCVSCGILFDRARVTARYCSSDCVRAAARTPNPKNRTDGICPRCGINPRAARSDGRLRGWCRPCESAQKAEYLRTDAGKAVMRRYLRSAKGKAAVARRNQRQQAKKVKS